MPGNVESWASVAVLMSIRSACFVAVGAAPVVVDFGAAAAGAAGAAFCMAPPVAGCGVWAMSGEAAIRPMAVNAASVRWRIGMSLQRHLLLPPNDGETN